MRPDPFGSKPLGHELKTEWLKADLLMAEARTNSWSNPRHGNHRFCKFSK
jgi:hypothetical protein